MGQLSLGPAWLAITLLGAGGIAAPGCRQRAQAVQSESALRLAVRQMRPAVERATGLAFKRDPVVLRRTRAQVREYVIHKLGQELPPADLRGVEAAYRLFGLIPDSLDLRKLMIDVFTEQIAGYYDPDSNALFVPADIEPFQERLVVSHELVHALQDQYLNLDSLIGQKRQNDRRSAAQAILEGQATLAQIQVLMPEQQLDSLPSFWDLQKALRNQQDQMRVFAQAPLWLRESLLFPYLGGADFVRWFGKTHVGKQPFGPGMPTSTEQILHPDRYAAGDLPARLAFTAPAPDPMGHEDNLGEFEIRLLFQQLLGEEAVAARLAAGWGGDRYRVLGRDWDVLVWYTVWDDAVAADRFARGLTQAWSRRARVGHQSRIDRLTIDGMPGVRLVDAPASWSGWRSLPQVRVVGKSTP